jgi:conserved oligomeric Golgi complex subunit 5
LKIRVPYQSLHTLVDRLHKLHQATDVLRRVSRFIILARRLRVQMAELNKPSDPVPDSGHSQPMFTTASEPFQPESEKERAISKAALTIAELS